MYWMLTIIVISLWILCRKQWLWLPWVHQPVLSISNVRHFKDHKEKEPFEKLIANIHSITTTSITVLWGGLVSSFCGWENLPTITISRGLGMSLQSWCLEPMLKGEVLPLNWLQRFILEKWQHVKDKFPKLPSSGFPVGHPVVYRAVTLCISEFYFLFCFICLTLQNPSVLCAKSYPLACLNSVMTALWKHYCVIQI
jgi:hypothetical protein